MRKENLNLMQNNEDNDLHRWLKQLRPCRDHVKQTSLDNVRITNDFHRVKSFLILEYRWTNEQVLDQLFDRLSSRFVCYHVVVSTTINDRERFDKFQKSEQIDQIEKKSQTIRYFCTWILTLCF